VNVVTCQSLTAAIKNDEVKNIVYSLVMLDKNSVPVSFSYGLKKKRQMKKTKINK
jgi:hypothetical protein